MFLKLLLLGRFHSGLFSVPSHRKPYCGFSVNTVIYVHRFGLISESITYTPLDYVEEIPV